MTTRAVAYYRVSTFDQGRSGLGIEAQKAAVAALCKTRGWEIIAEFTEVESGKVNDRPKLQAAMHQAKVTGATLVVAKLDRLSRSAAFLTALQESHLRFVAADMPEMNETVVGIMAVIARTERHAISERTRVALQAAKARGQKLGNPNGAAALRRADKGNIAAVETNKAAARAHAADLAPIVADIFAAGARTLRTVADELNARHIQTRRGCKWHPGTVAKLLERMSG